MAISQISEEEQKLLVEVAKAKGKTLQELLVELGHVKPETPVEFEGQAAPAATAVMEPPPPVVFAAASPVPDEALPQFEDMVQPEVEPPLAVEDPPPAQESAANESLDQTPATFQPICSQCGWDQTQPPIPEPEQQDKIAFLHAVLGQKVFSKRYGLFGNRLRLTFRSLTIKEIDALYQETFRAQKAGVITTAADYYEYLNRLRLYLQLTSMSSTETAMQIKLPEGLNRETNPDAGTYWESYLREAGIYQPPDASNPDSPTLLMQIQDYVLTQVLKTEHLQRAVTHACSKFNQLVVKLEMCVNNPDFWNETEPQS